MTNPVKNRMPWGSLYMLSLLGALYNWATGGNRKFSTRTVEIPVADKVDETGVTVLQNQNVRPTLSTSPVAAQGIIPQNLSLVPAFIKQVAQEQNDAQSKSLVPTLVRQIVAPEQENESERSNLRRFIPATPLLGLPFAAMNGGAGTDGASSAGAGAAGEGFFSSAYTAASKAFGYAWDNWNLATKLGAGVAGTLAAAYLAYKVYKFLNPNSGITINNNNNNTNTQNVNINLDCKGGYTIKETIDKDGTKTYTVSGGRQEELLSQLLKEVQGLKAATPAA